MSLTIKTRTPDWKQKEDEEKKNKLFKINFFVFVAYSDPRRDFGPKIKLKLEKRWMPNNI